MAYVDVFIMLVIPSSATFSTLILDLITEVFLEVTGALALPTQVSIYIAAPK
jgi:hypothetical protein